MLSVEDGCSLLETSQSACAVEDCMLVAAVIKDVFEGELVRKGSE